jgi:hypothetical protein
VKCKIKSYTSNNRGKLNHLRIIQTLPYLHAGKARNQGTTKALESTNVKVQNTLTREITLHVAKIVNTEELQHYVPS